MVGSLRRITVLIVMGALSLLALGAAAVPAAHAGGDKDFTCSNQGGSKNTVVCVGTVNGNDITVEVSDVRVLNDNEISILEDSLDKAVIKLIDVDVQTRVNKLAVDVVEIFNNKLDITITICQVKVVEVGVVNKNIAKC